MLESTNVEQDNQVSSELRNAWKRNPVRIEGLDISPADDGYIIYRAEMDRVHYLNPTAVLILEFCTGQNSPEQIVELVKQAYSLPNSPVKEVEEALQQLKAEGLLLSLDGLD